MNLGAGVHLTYCSNIHAAESWAEVRANFDRFVLAVRDRLDHEGDFGIGLRLLPPGVAEWQLMAAVLAGGLLASLVPGWRAYRLSLADGLTPRI